MTEINEKLIVKRFTGLQDYQKIWRAMQQFTQQRDENTVDECWLLQHAPVFTLGQAGKAEHLLNVTDIPVVNSDRGGQVTYHGPGQLMVYLLLDLKRRKLGVRDLVTVIEQSLVNFLQVFGIESYAEKKAPGVYINKAGTAEKIASLGLRVKQGCSYHGLALNVDMELAPFAQINPCGYPGLLVTMLANETTRPVSLGKQLEDQLLQELTRQLNINELSEKVA